MIKVVLDTNVIVSGLLSPFGPAGEIVRMIGGGNLIVCYDVRILSEYRDVLSRPQFCFSKIHTEYFLDQLEAIGEESIGEPLLKRLPDVDDEPFLEVAISSEADCLVTQNLRHYPVNKRSGVKVISPVEFLEFYRKRHHNE